ncbi:MAG: phosphatase PAP2 family protein [Ignavibacteria bacterium]|nr:phosphatase PAP2 family protein [Ignavibacteria bacterium]
MNPYSEKTRNYFYFYLVTAGAVLVMALILYIMPAETIQYRNSDFLAPFWHEVTQSGGFTGGLVIFIFLIAYLAGHFRKSSGKYSDLILIISIIFFAYVFSAGITEYILKDIYKKPRPYYHILSEKGYLRNGSQTFITMPYGERKKYLRENINLNDEKLSDVYSPVLNDWIYEAGFSFPSGHAHISFFWGTVISFFIFFMLKKKYKSLFIIPYIWSVLVCISRVVTGFHYSADVIAGSVTGALTGLIIVSLPVMYKNVN